jgi:hypothetical protein
MDGRRDQDPKERKEESESQGGLGEEEAIRFNQESVRIEGISYGQDYGLDYGREEEAHF